MYRKITSMLKPKEPSVLQMQNFNGAASFYLGLFDKYITGSHKAFLSKHDVHCKNLETIMANQFVQLEQKLSFHSNDKFNAALRLFYSGKEKMLPEDLEQIEYEINNKALLDEIDHLHISASKIFKEETKKYIEQAPSGSENVFQIEALIVEREYKKYAVRGAQLIKGDDDTVHKINLANIVKYNNVIGPNVEDIIAKEMKKSEKGGDLVEGIKKSAGRTRSFLQLMKDLDNAYEDFLKNAIETEEKIKVFIDKIKIIINSKDFENLSSSERSELREKNQEILQMIQNKNYLEIFKNLEDGIKEIQEDLETLEYLINDDYKPTF